MAKVRGKNDPCISGILGALGLYEKDHADARIEAYRQNSASVRIRIIDPDFSGQDLVDRDDLVWDYLAKLPEDTRSDITMLLLLTPDEAQTSFANLEFDDPVPSRL